MSRSNLSCSATLNMVSVFMSVPSATTALLASLLVIGCATKEQQPTAARAETEVQKYGTGWFAVGRKGGKLRYTDHENIAASEEFR